MNYHLNKILLIFGILIPSFLLSACSDKKEIYHISAKSKVWLGLHVKNIPERRLDNLKLDFGLEVIKVYTTEKGASIHPQLCLFPERSSLDFELISFFFYHLPKPFLRIAGRLSALSRSRIYIAVVMLSQNIYCKFLPATE